MSMNVEVQSLHSHQHRL